MEDCTDIHNAKTSLSGTALHWVDGDMVRIISAEGYGDYAATPQSSGTSATFNYVSGTNLSAEGTDYRAYYPSTINSGSDISGVTLPATQVSEDGSLRDFPMAARSQSTSLQFKNLCGVLKLNLQKDDVTVTSIKLTVDKQINGPFYIRLTQDGNLDAYEYPDEYGEPDNGVVRRGNPGNAELNTVTLQCNQSIDDAHDFYITLPQGTYNGLTLEITASDGSVCTKGPATGSVVIERSKYSTLTLAGDNLDFVTPLPEGALPGVFTINENGTQVHFSKGNLQYIGSASTPYWKFADHQYDYLSTSTGQNSSNTNVDRDLFGWGTGNNPNKTNLTGYSYSEWGNNAISNGGNTANSGWYTLSNAEWSYLFAHYQYGSATVNDKNGVIILPSNFVMPDGCDAFNTGVSGWDNNVYTLAEWEAMEANGAVFLPKAGRRMATNMGSGHLDLGQYWSKTSSSSNNSYLVVFTSGGLSITTTNHLYGCSVRLVRNI